MFSNLGVVEINNMSWFVQEKLEDQDGLEDVQRLEVAMNPVDHPMGGGEGKSSGGRHPVSPWGKQTKGLKTRKKNKKSNALIIKRRND